MTTKRNDPLIAAFCRDLRSGDSRKLRAAARAVRAYFGGIDYRAQGLAGLTAHDGNENRAIELAEHLAKAYGIQAATLPELLPRDAPPSRKKEKAGEEGEGLEEVIALLEEEAAGDDPKKAAAAKRALKILKGEEEPEKKAPAEALAQAIASAARRDEMDRACGLGRYSPAAPRAVYQDGVELVLGGVR